jgi:hypothetical protein
MSSKWVGKRGLDFRNVLISFAKLCVLASQIEAIGVRVAIFAILTSRFDNSPSLKNRKRRKLHR